MTSPLSLVQHYAEGIALRKQTVHPGYLMALKVRVYEWPVDIPHHLYFDETEKDDFVGVGGWLGTFQKWVEFESRWRKALPREANGDFHYTDFWARSPESYGQHWSDQRRIDHIRELAAITRDCNLMAVGICFSRKVYEKTIPKEHKKELVSPIHFAFGHCIAGLMAIYKEIEGPPSPWRVMFDRKKGQEGTLAELYYGAIATYDKEHIFGNLSFGNRNEEPPLQAADLLIGEARRYRAGHKSMVLDVLRDKGSLFLRYPEEDDFRKLVENVIAQLKNAVKP